MIRGDRRKLFAFLLLICLLVMPREVFAAPEGGDGGACEITIRYAHDGAPLPGAAFSLYQVGAHNAGNELIITDAFSAYAFDFDPQDTSAWHALANTLESYVQRDQLTPAGQERTDENGEAVFAGLAQGLYLVTGAQTVVGGYTYTPDPILVCLPYLEEGGAAQYSVLLAPKMDVTPPGQPEQVSVSVVKVWRDSGTTAYRPVKITAELLRDGAVCQTVELTAANNWRHTWSDLPAGHTYRVTEREVPEAYTVSIERENSGFVITNSIRPGTPQTPDDPRLPQTGMLQWPVFALSAAGLLAICAGWLLKKGAAGEKEGKQDEV